MSSDDEPARRARIREILDELAGIGYALPGAIVRSATACGKPGCRCQAGPPRLHGPYRSWIRKAGGKPATRALSPGQQERCQPWIDGNHRLQDPAVRAGGRAARRDRPGRRNRGRLARPHTAMTASPRRQPARLARRTAGANDGASGPGLRS